MGRGGAAPHPAPVKVQAGPPWVLGHRRTVALRPWERSCPDWEGVSCFRVSQSWLVPLINEYSFHPTQLSDISVQRLGRSIQNRRRAASLSVLRAPGSPGELVPGEELCGLLSFSVLSRGHWQCRAGGAQCGPSPSDPGVHLGAPAEGPGLPGELLLMGPSPCWGYTGCADNARSSVCPLLSAGGTT